MMLLGVAVITAIVGPMLVAWQAKRLRAENTSQHAEGRALLSQVLARLDEQGEGVATVAQRTERIEGKVDDVVAWQANHERLHRSWDTAA